MYTLDVRVGYIYTSDSTESFLVYDIRNDLVICKYVDQEGIPDNSTVFSWSITSMQIYAEFNPKLTALYMFDNDISFCFTLNKIL